MIKIGVLGCGNMGGSILRGWAASASLAGSISLYAFDRSPQLDACAAENVTMLASALELAKEVDWLVLAVKPQQVAEVMTEIKGELGPEKLIISIAAGLAISRLKEFCGRKSPVIRVMPNLPAMVGQGIFGLCFDDPAISAEQQSMAERLFAALGLTLTMPEEKFNAFTALSGGGPAYVYYLMDAMTEAGVYLGIPRQEALRVVMAMVKGSLALAEETEQPLYKLLEQVCSPGGTTIEAIVHFDRTGIRGHLLDGIALACEKGKKLG